ncbi:PREDICTED: uncharacterized protein LOC105124456 [Populus euphratica]|uniref:Uncharacterized protein LOC105124456 n=1 Tax=Populus euphratica TaxID=75702 RepID=A0AAJ6XKY5_POPEU|nr:PREDICTED: uncharacterized protein LOC105124456 [Populus euphratica]
MKQETLTLVLVNFAGIMQRADESLLPGVYKEVGAALHTDPTGLGSLTLFRSVVQSSCYPLAAYLAVHHNRAHVIALGAFLWAAATFLVAISSTFLQVAISRGLNGIGLAIVIPAIQSLVADSTDESNRGMAFGWLQLTGNLGSIIGNLCSVLLATTSFMGIAGWRVSFHLVGIISVIVGVLVYLFAKDPHFSDADGRAKDKTPQTFISEFKDLIKDAKSVVKIPTFQILVAQGVSGTFPWSGLSFAPMWLELIGFSHKQTASLLNIFVIGGSFGSLFGGRMGDILAKRLPNSGRIMLSQISAGSSIPLAGILLLVLPYDPSTAFMHGLVFFTMGLCTSWNAPATNNPIFAEIVPERSRTTIYALDNSFESVLSSFAPPIVGILAQRLYGYKVPKTSSDSVKVETDRENAVSLAKALFMSFVVPMSICVFIYSFLYWSYPRDRERAKMNALIESEMQQVEAQDSTFGEEYSQLHLSESKGLDGKETAETDVEYGKIDRLDFDDDSDDKALLSKDSDFRETSTMKQETLTLVLVNLAGIMERADESLLPGVYKEVGAALHTDPTGLGSLTLFRSIVQSSCYPLAAYLAVHHNRAHVIALGAFLWAAATFLVAISSTFLEVAVSRGLNGIGLAIVTPAIQSLVADSTDESNRGMAFGWLQLTGNLGSIIGGLCSVLIASRTFVGIPGWRVAFHLVGIISVIVGIMVRLFANDPRFSDTNSKARDQSPKSFISEVKYLVKEAKSVIKIPSFQIIVAQGVSGSFPWSALSFAPMWLELIGFSHEKTAFLMALFVVAGSLGGLFGGKMGDVLAKRFPNSGRIFLSQISSGSAIPLAAVLLLVLPDDPSTTFIHGLVFFIMGFCVSWNGPATNNPIFAEIVPQKSRASVYALDRSFESVLSSFAPPTVGILAQHVYGYKTPKKSLDNVKVITDRENAASLAKALYTAIGIPMALCCFIYSFLYCTYPRDRERARMTALIELEMQQLETDDSPLREEHTRLNVSETNGLDGDERTEIDIKNGSNESIDFNDDDEKALLYRQLTFSNLAD